MVGLLTVPHSTTGPCFGVSVWVGCRVRSMVSAHACKSLGQPTRWQVTVRLPSPLPVSWGKLVAPYRPAALRMPTPPDSVYVEEPDILVRAPPEPSVPPPIPLHPHHHNHQLRQQHHVVMGVNVHARHKRHTHTPTCMGGEKGCYSSCLRCVC